MAMEEVAARARDQIIDTRPLHEPAMIIEATSFCEHYGGSLDIRNGLVGSL